MLDELRSALRIFARRPAFAMVVVGLLALGIGANTTIFSMVRAVLLRPLPFAEPDRLVYLWRADASRPVNHGIQTGNDVISLREELAGLSDIAALKSWEHNSQTQLDLFTPDGAERLRGTLATPNWFETLGVRAAIGRTFREPDADLGPVVVLSDGFWRRRFAADPAILGQPLSLVGGWPRTATTYTIVGVLPPAFRFTYPRETEVWVMSPWSEIAANGAIQYQVVGRLHSGATAGTVQAEGTTVYQQRSATSGRTATPVMFAEPLPEHLKRDARAGVRLVAGVAALVLLIACVNVGLLVMARTVDRRRELAICSALGASRWQLVRRMLAEGTVLGVAGGVVGVALAYAAQPALGSLIPPAVARGDEVAIDLQVLAFGTVVMLLSVVVCGLTPAALALRWNVQSTLRRASGTMTADRVVTRSRRLVVVVQVAVVTVLALAAGLLLQSFLRLHRVDLGFDGRGVTMVELRLMNPKYVGQPDQVGLFENNVLERIRALPGVQDAAVTTAVPLQGRDVMMNTAGGSRMREVDLSYFDLLRIQVVAGRPFSTGDTAEAPAVTIVSEALARKLFGTANPLGQTLGEGPDARRIVGVAHQS